MEMKGWARVYGGVTLVLEGILLVLWLGEGLGVFLIIPALVVAGSLLLLLGFSIGRAVFLPSSLLQAFYCVVLGMGSYVMADFDKGRPGFNPAAALADKAWGIFMFLLAPYLVVGVLFLYGNFWRSVEGTPVVASEDENTDSA